MHTYTGQRRNIPRGRGTGGGGNGGMRPHPPTIFKSEKSALFSGLKCHIYRTKKYFLNERLLLLERKCSFCSNKDSVKAISDVMETPYFQNFRSARERHNSFDFSHIQKCPFWPMPLHFRNASTAYELLTFPKLKADSYTTFA